MTTGQFGETCARLALVSDWLSVTTWNGTTGSSLVGDPASRLAASVLRAYSRMSHGEAAGPAASLQVDVRIGDCEVVLMADATALRSLMASAMAGALVRARHPANTGSAVPVWWPAPLSVNIPGSDCSTEGNGEGKRRDDGSLLIRVGAAASGERAHDSDRYGLCFWTEPIDVTAQGAPRCMVGNTLDESRAVFAEAGSTRGTCIDEDGSWEADDPWPKPISGVARWGSEGAIAWRNGDVSHVMWRDRPGGEVHDEAIPFRASLAYPQPDGSVWWTALSGGLWSWFQGEWRQLVETPPVMSLHVERDGVRLDPRGEDATFETRPRATDAFIWEPGTQSVTRRPVGPEGPIWSTSMTRGWTATAYPFADQIHLRHVDGAERVLVSPAPFSVAWAGRSLVTSTREGQLLVFRDILVQLERVRSADTAPGKKLAPVADAGSASH